MTDLKSELASLRIDATRPARSPWRWPLLLLRAGGAAAGRALRPAARQAFAAVEVEIGQTRR